MKLIWAKYKAKKYVCKMNPLADLPLILTR